MSSVRLKRHRQDYPHGDVDAPVPVRRPKRNLLRRHWLSGALIFTLVAVSAYSAQSFFETERQLQEVRARAAKLDQEIEAKKRLSKELDDRIAQISSDQYLEYLAKSMGYVYPNESVYQKGTGKGQ